MTDKERILKMDEYYGISVEMKIKLRAQKLGLVVNDSGLYFLNDMVSRYKEANKSLMNVKFSQDKIIELVLRSYLENMVARLADVEIGDSHGLERERDK